LVNTTNGQYQLPPDAPSDALAEVDSAKYIPAYEEGIRWAGCEPIVHEGVPDPEVIQWLREVQPDICFNVCEGFGGESREAHMPAVLEMLGLRYSGPSPLAAAVTQDKPTTKRLLAAAGLPTPSFQVFSEVDEPLHPDLTFPLLVKPSHEGTGMGIRNESITRDPQSLRGQIEHVLEKYRQPALVESYIEGRDITCGLVGNFGNGSCFRVLPILEVDFSGYPGGLAPVYSSFHKNDLDHLFRFKCPAPLPEEIATEVRRLTCATFAVTGCRDFGRVDFRLTPEGKLHILEINGLPGITPRSDMTVMARMEGISHPELVGSILKAALLRYHML
jgi:D-alanine-D-alanine ligase